MTYDEIVRSLAVQIIDFCTARDLRSQIDSVERKVERLREEMSEVLAVAANLPVPSTPASTLLDATQQYIAHLAVTRSGLGNATGTPEHAAEIAASYIDMVEAYRAAGNDWWDGRVIITHNAMSDRIYLRTTEMVYEALNGEPYRIEKESDGAIHIATTIRGAHAGFAVDIRELPVAGSQKIYAQVGLPVWSDAGYTRESLAWCLENRTSVERSFFTVLEPFHEWYCAAREPAMPPELLADTVVRLLFYGRSTIVHGKSQQSVGIGEWAQGVVPDYAPKFF